MPSVIGLHRRGDSLDRRAVAMSQAAVYAFGDSAVAAARKLADRLGIPAHRAELHRFPDGELKLRLAPVASTSLLYLPLDKPNEKLIAMVLAAERLRRGGARRLVLVSPYLCYMRQDSVFQEGEAISQRAIAELISRYVDRVVTIETHLHRAHSFQEVFPTIEADNLKIAPAIAQVLRGSVDPRTVVIGPDQESGPSVRDLAARLDLEGMTGTKERRGDRSVTISIEEPERLHYHPALIVDDIVSTGGTLAECARAVRAAGASRIDVIVTHALFAPEEMHGFAVAGIRTLRSTESVPHPSNAIPVDSILAAALEREIER
jgi:ribose-phosphate pyrophosphokinase